MTTEEGKIQKAILDYLNWLPHCKAIKIIIASEDGNPDVICVYRGHPVFIEVKRDEAHAKQSDKDQKIQKVRREEWREAGAYCVQAWTVKQVDKLIGSIRL